jgi:hypothetical protein
MTSLRAGLMVAPRQLRLRRPRELRSPADPSDPDRPGLVPGATTSCPEFCKTPMCRNASPEPSPNSTNPKPFSSLNHLTVVSTAGPLGAAPTRGVLRNSCRGARSAYHARRTYRHHIRAPVRLDLVPFFPSSSATSVRSLSHHPEVVLGVLIVVLGFDPIAIQRRFACQCQIPFVISVRVASPVLAPPIHGIGAADRLLPSLRPRVPTVASVHPVISRCYLRAMPLRMQESAA